MVVGLEDEQRSCCSARGSSDKTSALPPKKASRGEDLRAKTRSSEREGKGKKDKNQNLQRDKCFQVSIKSYSCVSEMLRGFLLL